MHLLDDRKTYERLDPDGLGGRIGGLAQQCREAWDRAKKFDFPHDFQDVDRLIVIGLGGSAIAGDIVRALAMPYGHKAVLVYRGYNAPPLVDNRSLTVACSHSGETEEVLSAFAKALASESKKLVITTGGKLLATAQSWELPAYTYSYAGEPRSALGESLMPLLATAQAARALPNMDTDIKESIALLEEMKGEIEESVPFERNAAKQMASRMEGKLPVVYGAEVLTEAAHRWKTQFNENSKVWAFYEELSEANHNAIEGYGLAKGVAERAYVVFLHHSRLHSRLTLRYQATQEALTAAGVTSERVEARGESDLARILTASYLGDYVSYYLAMVNGVRPSPVPAIQKLKGWLASEK